eukprot:SAG25_NODE_194_length_12183_cov_70.943893_14_plen_74_part_00
MARGGAGGRRVISDIRTAGRCFSASALNFSTLEDRVLIGAEQRTEGLARAAQREAERATPERSAIAMASRGRV